MTWLNPLRWLRWGVHFTRAWCVSLPLWRMGPASGALAGTLLLGGGAWVAQEGDSGWRIREARQGLTAALAQHDLECAELLAARVLHSHPEDARLRFLRAQIRLERGEQVEAATDQLRSLALRDRQIDAMLWMLEHDYASAPEDLGSDAAPRQPYRELLTQIIRQRPEHREARARLADLLLGLGESAEALPHLLELIPVEPHRAIQAAEIYRREGQTAQAERVADQGLRRLEQLAQQHPGDADVRLAEARVLLAMERYAEAAKRLGEAMRRSDDVRLRHAAAETLVAWSAHLDRSSVEGDDSALIRQLAMLRRAIALAPNNPRVMNQVIAVVLRAASAGPSDPAVAEMGRALVRGIEPEMVHFIRGTAAMLRGDADRAANHLEIAARSLPAVAEVLNNLAVTLSQRQPADLPRALRLVDAALEHQPGHPYFRETRGQILLGLGRPREAIPDLEAALGVPELAPEVHRALAEAYRGIGEPQLARAHAERIEGTER